MWPHTSRCNACKRTRTHVCAHADTHPRTHARILAALMSAGGVNAAHAYLLAELNISTNDVQQGMRAASGIYTRRSALQRTAPHRTAPHRTAPHCNSSQSLSVVCAVLPSPLLLNEPYRSFTHTHARMHARMHVCTHARTYVCTHARTHVRTCAHCVLIR